MSDILAMVILLYVVWATFYGIKIVRGGLMNWYNSQAFFVRGKGPVDIFLSRSALESVGKYLYCS